MRDTSERLHFFFFFLRNHFLTLFFPLNYRGQVCLAPRWRICPPGPRRNQPCQHWATSGIFFCTLEDTLVILSIRTPFLTPRGQICHFSPSRRWASSTLRSTGPLSPPSKKSTLSANSTGCRSNRWALTKTPFTTSQYYHSPKKNHLNITNLDLEAENFNVTIL